MDEKTRKELKESKKRMKFFYDRKATELMYGEEFLKSFKCIPKMSIVGIIKLIPAFIISQLFALIIEFGYYIYITLRKIAVIRNPEIIAVVDQYWNSGMDDWNKCLDNYINLAETWDNIIKIEASIQQKILERC